MEPTLTLTRLGLRGNLNAPLWGELHFDSVGLARFVGTGVRA